MNLPQVDIIDASIGILARSLSRVPGESLDIGQSAGRVLAAPLRADRDSPAISVSAMDGYALRWSDLSQRRQFPVQSTTPAGSPPMELAAASAVRIFTGAPVPLGADCIVKREDTVESTNQVTIQVATDSIQVGQHIRRKGENIAKDAVVLESGTFLTPASMAAIASFGAPRIQVYRKVRVSVLNTGDELAPAGQPVQDWQIRDSNGPVLDAWLRQMPWIELVAAKRVGDQHEEVKRSIQAALDESDAVLLTGGVSMGDTDHVPAAIEELGGTLAFHRLPLRPGRPILGASLSGKLILGLPGNPVSVAITSRIFGAPLLRTLGGVQPAHGSVPQVAITDADTARIDLIWYRLVDLGPNGEIRFSKTLGSGDLVSLAKSYGFVRVPAGDSGPGPWPLYRW